MPGIIPAADIAQQLLNATVAGYAGAGVALSERRYVTAGDAAWDDEQVTVELLRLTGGVPGSLALPEIVRGSYPLTRAGEYRVTVVRAVPVIGEAGELPSPEELNIAGIRGTTDMALLYGALLAWAQTVAPGTPSALGDVVPISPAGGLGGVQATIFVGFPIGVT